ncbi:hypothetical protein [Cryobacterium sp. BB307]|uniref:hypothetical protein n=1 Tax=Cryobacterium sp. BB307 TaxID=2716317 RepID=UPI001444C5AA|nr:hypothetical protein [Cryobacterium sp. BB307]
MSGHTSRIPHWLQEHGSVLGLQSADLAVYAALLHECDWRSGITRRVSMATIARLALMRSTTTAEASIKRLVRAGVVAIHERGINRPHVYRLGMIPEALSPQNMGTEQAGTEALSSQNLVGTPQNLVPQSPESGDDLEHNSFKGASPLADTEEFDRFWSLYPTHRRGAKKPTRAAWDESQPPADVVARLRAWIPTTDPRFVPRAEKWLHERRWELVKITSPSAEYLAWLETPEGQAHAARKEAG